MEFDAEYFKNYKKQKFRWDFWKSYVYRNFPKGSRVLYVGCAYGFLLSELERDYDCYGIDISEHAVEVAKENAVDSKVFVMDAEKMKFDVKFDVIFCLDVLEHLKNPEKCLKGCFGLLKENGGLIVSTPNMDSVGRKLKGKDWFGYKDKTHVSLFSSGKWRKLLRDGGFKIRKEFTDGFFDVPYFKYFKRLQKLFLIPGYLQYKIRIPFMRFGENLVFICEKN